MGTTRLEHSRRVAAAPPVLTLLAITSLVHDPHRLVRMLMGRSRWRLQAAARDLVQPASPHHALLGMIHAKWASPAWAHDQAARYPSHRDLAGKYRARALHLRPPRHPGWNSAKTVNRTSRPTRLLNRAAVTLSTLSSSFGGKRIRLSHADRFEGEGVRVGGADVAHGGGDAQAEYAQ